MNNRVIKFRAWKDGKMLSWTELVKGGTLLVSLSEYYMTNPPRPVAEFMQFTGLLDKNGKEIYEGDVIMEKGRPREVIFHQGAFCVYMYEDDSDILARNTYHLFDPKMKEVLGNIHENPELLK